jgi:preprotein translocase subunit SecG
MKFHSSEEQIKRKIIAVTVFLMVIFLCLRALPVHAQSATVVKIQPDSTDVGLGQTVEISVFITGGVDVNAFDIGITYDPAIVSLESYQTGDYLSNLAKFFEETTTGHKRLAYAQLATPGVNGDGTLITFTFKGLAEGNSDISFDFAQLSNYSSEPISFSSQNGTIHVFNPATLTFTPTPTASATSTQTATITLTPTETSTGTLPATATPTVTRTSTLTATATNTPTLTRTPTITRTPTRTSTITPIPTRTRTPINTLVLETSTYVPSATLLATNTLQPTQTSAAFLTLTQLPVPLTGNETPSPTETRNAGGVTPTSPLPILETGGQAPNGWWSQFVCIFTIFLLIALLILLAVLLRRRKNDASTSGN